MKKLLSGALAAIVSLGLAAGANAAGGGPALPKQDWSFAGVFGKFDRAALQRGFQVYREVCAGCHSLNLIAFRNLGDLGYNEDEIKTFAAEVTVIDGPDDDGEMFEREGRPSDYFPAPFPNTKAAAAANGGAVPPDLSLMAKARTGGTDYIHALLIGYAEVPENWRDVEEFHYLLEEYGEKGYSVLEGLSFNHYFSGHQTAMAPPLYDEAVEYGDGTETSVEQMAHDVSTFLMWAAEPKLEARKGMGIKVMLFLLVFTGMLYAAKRKIWADLH